MFRRSKSQVLVDRASGEDDASRAGKDALEEEEEEAVAAASQEAKAKKAMSKKERKDKKSLSSKDDKDFLLSAEKLADGRGKRQKADGALRLWQSVTKSARRASPAKESRGRREDAGGAPEAGRGPVPARPQEQEQEDGPRRGNRRRDLVCAAAWTSKLAAMGGPGRRLVSHGAWEGLK